MTRFAALFVLSALSAANGFLVAPSSSSISSALSAAKNAEEVDYDGKSNHGVVSHFC